MNDINNQANNSAKSEKHNKGVICDVRSCAYHDGDNYCSAKQISVGPSSACKCSETVCATFKNTAEG